MDAIMVAAVLADDDDDDFYTILSELFETSSSSSSSSNSSLEESEEKSTPMPILKKRKKGIYIDIAACDEETFRENFRISRSTMLGIIENFEESDYYSPESHISAESAVLMTAWYLTNRETFSQISVRFNVAKSTSHKVIYNVIDWLVNISQDFVKWPDDELQNYEEFKTICDIDGVIGCLGVTHILTPKPLENAEAYRNKKGQYSIILQGVVDKNKKFMDVYCDGMGSLSDTQLLKQSKLCRKFSSDAKKYFILGGSNYPNFPWLVTSFEENGRLSNNQKVFNYKHFQTHVIADQTLELLKGRFRRLQGFENSNVDFIVHCIMATCVLHNICIDAQDDGFDAELNETDAVIDEIKTEVVDRRDEIFNKMFSK